MIDLFISITTYPMFAILLRPIDSCFDITGPYKRCSALLFKVTQFLSKILPSFDTSSFLARNLACLLFETFIQLFLPFLFSSSFCYVDPSVFCIVSGDCNTSFFALFLVDFESMYCFINAICNAVNWSFSFVFLTSIICHRYLWDTRPYAWSLVFLMYGPFFRFFPRPLQEWSRIYNKRDNPDVYFFYCVPANKLGVE